MVERRRLSDERVDQIVADLEDLKSQVSENTAITVEVRDFLATLRTMSKIAKWITAVSAAVTATILAIKSGADFNGPR